MRGFRTGRFGAILGFTLVAAVVLGGMTWATASTWQLAKINVEREHRDRLSKAVLLMDTYMSGILGEEMGRPFTDYMQYYTVEPVEVWRRNENLEADRVVLASPIAKPRSSTFLILILKHKVSSAIGSKHKHKC